MPVAIGPYPSRFMPFVANAAGDTSARAIPTTTAHITPVKLLFIIPPLVPFEIFWYFVTALRFLNT
jgi:hypothetical protein